MVHASALFFAALAAAATSTSAWARPVFAREPTGFGVDTDCLGFNYLFGGPHHTPTTRDVEVEARDHGADGAGIDVDLSGVNFGSIIGSRDVTA